MASVSKDGTWKLWNIGVEWQKGQDPKCIQTAKARVSPQAESSSTRCALSPDGRHGLRRTLLSDLKSINGLTILACTFWLRFSHEPFLSLPPLLLPRSLAVSSVSDLSLYQSSSGVEELFIADVHSSISGLLVDASNRFVITCGDKVARAFHNVAGYKGPWASDSERFSYVS